MTLGRLLKKYDHELGLKVGSADGNCYFYCGTVGDFLENIEEYSNDIFEYANKKLIDENERCKYFISDFLRKIKKDTKRQNEFPDNYLYRIETNIKELYHIIESKDYAKKKVECFIPLNNRKVVNYRLTDKASEPEDCLAVIIKGSECGKFWVMEDAKERHLDFNLSYYGTVPDDLENDE